MVLEESELVSGKYYVSEGIMVARGEITGQQKEAMLRHNQVPRRMIIAGPFDSREEANQGRVPKAPETQTVYLAVRSAPQLRRRSSVERPRPPSRRQ